MRRVLALLLACALATGVAAASDTVLAGRDGHPRERFPLALRLTGFGDPGLDAAAARAVDDWNRVAQDALGVSAFIRVDAAALGAVLIERQPADPGGLMGVTDMASDADGTITLPVRIVVHEPAARGQTSRETILYQVLAHELGHALGLPHTNDPRSLMCCRHAALDFGDPAVRAAYIEARRHPDVGTVRGELAAHYERFWRR